MIAMRSLVILVLIIGLGEANSQVQITSVLEQQECDIAVALVSGSDTLVAGALGMVCYLRGSVLEPLAVPSPFSEITIGATTSNGFLLVESTGSILDVRSDRVVRLQLPDRAVGIGRYLDSLLVICSASMHIVNDDGQVVRSVSLALGSPIVAGGCSGNVVVLATKDAAAFVVNRMGEPKLIDRLDREIYTVVGDRELFYISGVGKTWVYSIAKNRLVSLSLAGSGLSKEIQDFATRFVFASDSTKGRVMMHLNPSVGNTQYSPVYACERVDTVLRVLHQYTKEDISSGYSFSAAIATVEGELVFGRYARCLKRSATTVQWRLNRSWSQALAVGREADVTAGAVVTFDSAMYSIDVRFRRSKLDSWSTVPLVKRISSRMNVTCLLTIHSDTAYVRLSDSLFVVPCKSGAAAEFRGLLPNGYSNLPMTIDSDAMILSSSWANSSAVSTDHGRTWNMFSGKLGILGGDGLLYSSASSKIFFRTLQKVIPDDPDTIDLKILAPRLISAIFPTAAGVLVFDRDNDRSLSELTHRVLKIENGVIMREDTFTMQSSDEILSGLPVLVGTYTVALLSPDGRRIYLLDPQTGGIHKKTYDLSAIDRYGVMFDASTRFSRSAHLSMVTTAWYIVDYDVDGVTSVNNEPSIQWVAIRNAYPNPTERVLNVTISSLPTADYLTWRIGLYRLDGSLAIDCKPYTAPWTITTTQQTISVPIHGLPSGMYYLASVNRGYAESKQIVVVR